MMTRIFALTSLLILAACSVGPQSKAGITYFEYERCKTGDAFEICKVKIGDGKERDSVTLTLTRPGGTSIKYVATNVRAFKGQEIRAAVEKAISADVKAIAPGIVGAVVKAVVGIP